MSREGGKVIPISRARALKEALKELHSPQTRDAVYAGATGEFKRLVAPVLRELLETKGSPKPFQDELITLLEKVYATHHLDRRQSESILAHVKALVSKSE